MNLTDIPKDYKLNLGTIDDEAKKFGVNWEKIYSQI